MYFSFWYNYEVTPPPYASENQPSPEPPNIKIISLQAKFQHKESYFKVFAIFPCGTTHLLREILRIPTHLHKHSLISHAVIFLQMTQLLLI